MGKEVLINTKYGPQLLLGLFLGVWLYLFLVLVGPFDAAELTLSIRTILMFGYSLVFFLCYVLLIPVQNRLHQYRRTWTLSDEIATVLFFCLYSLPACFAYYKTDIVNGTYSFTLFTLTIYLPTIAILLPVIFLGRHLLGRHEEQKVWKAIKQETVTLRGSNKLDILNLHPNDLVAIEAANNYVAVYYLLEGKLQKKLLRSSLSKIRKSVPQMMQVHRSYLVNGDHFIEWKDGMTLGLTQIEIPVSQKYKPTLLASPLFAPR